MKTYMFTQNQTKLHTHTHTHKHTHTHTHKHKVCCHTAIKTAAIAYLVTDPHSPQKRQPWCLCSNTAELWVEADNQQPVV